MSTRPPVLTTSRLVLRAHALGDFDAMMALWGDPEVTRFLGNVPFTREESWSRFLRYFGLWPALGFGYFVVTDRQSGSFLGEVGLADFKRQISPSLDGFAEAGWVLAQEAWGKGIAREALGAVLSWYSSQSAPRPVACIMNADHHASRRVAEQSGFVEVARTQYKEVSALVFHHKG